MRMERRGCVSSKRVPVTRVTGRNRPSLRRLEAATFQGHGWHEPYESRDSRTDLWGTGGEIPPVYPVANNTYYQPPRQAATADRGSAGGVRPEATV